MTQILRNLHLTTTLALGACCLWLASREEPAATLTSATTCPARQEPAARQNSSRDRSNSRAMLGIPSHLAPSRTHDREKAGIRTPGETPLDIDQVAEEALWNNVLRYIKVTPDQRERLHSLHRAYAEIEEEELSPEEEANRLKSLPSEEEILGEAQTQALRDAQEKDDDKNKTEEAERMMAFLEYSSGVHFDEKQKQKLLGSLKAYGDPDADHQAEIESAYLSNKLGLNPDQSEKVRETIDRFLADPSEARNAYAGEGAEDDGVQQMVGNRLDTNESLLNDKALGQQLAGILTEQQLQAYQQLVESRHNP